MPSFLKFFRVEDPVVMAVKVTTLEKILKIPPSAFEREVFYTFKLRPFLLFNSCQSNIKLHNKLYQGKFFPCSCRDLETSSP